MRVFRLVKIVEYVEKLNDNIHVQHIGIYSSLEKAKHDACDIVVEDLDFVKNTSFSWKSNKVDSLDLTEMFIILEEEVR